MRRLLAVFAVLVAVWITSIACGFSSENGPTAPVTVNELEAAAALEEAAARTAAIAFLQAYVDAPSDGVDRLRKLSAARDLRRWARWLGVQNREFPGRQVGQLELSAVRGSSRVPIEERPGDLVRDIDVDATATFRLTPRMGDALVTSRSLNGPVRVVHTGPGQWLIFEFTRDGIPLTRGFEVLRPPVVDRLSGLTVTLDSFVSVPVWQFDLVVRLRTAPVTLDASDAMLVDRAGAVIARANVVTRSIATVRPTGEVQGLVTFDPLSSSHGLTLRLGFRADHRGDQPTRVVELALSGRIDPVPITAPSSPGP
jgi:hypothetical protein